MNELEVFGFDPSQLDVFNQNEAPKSAGNPLIYKTSPALSKSEDGHYRCVFKIIYNPFNVHQSVLEQQSYGLQDNDGWFTVISSLTNQDKNCPIFKAWKKCHFAKPENGGMDKILYDQALPTNKGGKGLFDKRYARYVVVQILEDANQPDKVGKFMFWKAPKAIWEMVESKIKPSEESKKAKIPVMDFLFGRSIELEVIPGAGNPGDETYGRDTKYIGEFSEDTVPCVNPDGSPMLNDDEQDVLNNYVAAMNPIWKSRDPEERKRMEAEVNADPNTIKLRQIYVKVMEQIKTVCPNLIEELSYKPWDANVTARVDNWIKKVLAGKDPKEDDAPEGADKVGTEKTTDTTTNTTSTTSTTTSTTVDTTDESDTTDDLPF
jgi:hypothetical protein